MMLITSTILTGIFSMAWLKTHIVAILIGLLSSTGAFVGGQVASEHRLTKVESSIEEVEAAQMRMRAYVPRFEENSRDIQELKRVQLERAYLLEVVRENATNIGILLNDAAQTAPLIIDLTKEVNQLNVEVGKVKTEVVHTNKQLDNIIKGTK